MSDANAPLTSLEVRSIATPDNTLELSLERVETGDPRPGEIVVRVQAAPINPTDLGMLLGAADPSRAEVHGDGDDRRLTIPLSPDQAAFFQRRIDLSLCPGLEGAGTVVAAGPGGEHLLGRTVAMFGGGLFAQYRKIAIADCLVPADGTPPERAAAMFVNPLTVLAMIETLRQEGHRALVHTVAGSNLGQILNRVCLQDGVDLVNIVRRPEHVDLLHGQGALYVCDSSEPDFVERLTGMIRATGATLAFDPIGGGGMASTVLEAMEAVYAPDRFSVYGSSVMKQVYVYGRLNPGRMELSSGAGLAWGASGWLLMNRLGKLDGYTVQHMKNRIVRDLNTTFASSFSGAVSLHGLLDPSTLARSGRRGTGEKFLLVPS